MPTAVLRVDADPQGKLSPEHFDAAVATLRRRGLEVISAPAGPPGITRQIELIVADPGDTAHLALCRAVFGPEAGLGVVTYVSRGTDEDALGVLVRFGLGGRLERSCPDPVRDPQEELVTVTLPARQRRLVPQSRLLTALEAALNCEVRIEFEDECG